MFDRCVMAAISILVLICTVLVQFKNGGLYSVSFAELEAALIADDEEVPVARILSCYCDGSCPNNVLNGTCETRPGGFCFSTVEEVYDETTDTYEEERTYGCMPPADDGGLMMCQANVNPHHNGKNIICCSTENFCNRSMQPVYTPKLIEDLPKPIKSGQYAILITVSIFCSSSALIVLVLIVCLSRKQSEKPQRTGSSKLNTQTLSRQHSRRVVSGAAESVDWSGSGGGATVLVQSTIAKQLKMIQRVDKGRFGEVWLAKWRDELVAVKTFNIKEQDSWVCETDIYQTVIMRHENILGFIGADIKKMGCWTEMFLITEYHDYGSLHNYLSTIAIDSERLQLLAYTLASGLAYLHEELFGTPGKFAIAHRDIKSKNILVKRNGQCVIADFGLAIKYSSASDNNKIVKNIRVGTRRYMSPEVLSQKLNPSQFEEFKRADMYSVGLVLWEMARRCHTNVSDAIGATTCDEYKLPYYDVVNSDPSFEEMYDVVCVRGYRPQIPPRWQKDDVLVAVTKIMQECWHPNPAVRLTALRVKKTLARLEERSDGSYECQNEDCFVYLKSPKSSSSEMQSNIIDLADSITQK